MPAITLLTQRACRAKDSMNNRISIECETQPIQRALNYHLIQKNHSSRKNKFKCALQTMQPQIHKQMKKRHDCYRRSSDWNK